MRKSSSFSAVPYIYVHLLFTTLCLIDIPWIFRNKINEIINFVLDGFTDYIYGIYNG